MLPLEAVPNFSEGRDRATIDAIGEALAGARAPARRPLGRGPQPLGLHARRRARRSSSPRCSPASRARASGSTCAGTRARTRASAPPTSSRSSRSGRPMPSARAPRLSSSRGGWGRSSRCRSSSTPTSRAGRGPAFFRRGGPARAAAAHRRRRARSGLRPGAARRAGGRRPRRRASAADRLQRQPRRRRPRRGAGGGAGRARARRRLPGSARARAPPAAGRARPGEPQRRGLAGVAAARGRRRGASGRRPREGFDVTGSELVGLLPAGAAVAAAGSLLGVAGLDPSHVLELRLLDELATTLTQSRRDEPRQIA